MDLISIFAASNIDSEELDSLVEDATTYMATRINNSGIEQQVTFLNKNNE